MEHDLGQSKDALTEAKNHVTAVEASVKLLDTWFAKHKADVFGVGSIEGLHCGTLT